MTSIYDLSWGETSFLAKLQLFLKSQKQEKEKMQSNDRQVQAQGYSALSSTYYSIVGTAFSQLKATLRPKWLMWLAPFRIMLWGFTWLPLTAWCYWQMLSLSNRMVELIGYEGMSADQCDVRQSVLRRRGQYEEAKRCIQAALAKNPEKAHTRGLLRVGLAEIYRHEGDWSNAETEVKNALAEAEKAEKQDPRQAARIYRHCADITDFVEQGDPIPASQLRRKAQELAHSAGAQDQLLKL
jgi:tetratricopeptide (TPR) repeat protein